MRNMKFLKEKSEALTIFQALRKPFHNASTRGAQAEWGEIAEEKL